MVGEPNMADSNSLETVLKHAYDSISPAVIAAGIAFWHWNLKTGEVYLDEQWLKMAGYQAGEIEPNRLFWEDTIHPEDRSRVKRALQSHLKGLTLTYKNEHRILKKSGDYIWILDSGKVIEWDDHNKPKHIFGISIDIHEKVISRQRIQESEEKYKSIFDHLNDAFCRFDLTGKILEVNKNLSDLMGVKIHDLSDSNIKLFFNNQTIKYLHRRLARILENKSIDFETEIITPRRKILPVSISARLITTSGNGIVQALIRDITERKAFEKALFEEKQTFKALIEHSPNIICRHGRNLKCQYITPNIVKVIGLTAEQCIGKRSAELTVPPVLASFIEDKMKWVFRKNKEMTIDFSFDTLIGTRHFEATIVPEINNSNVIETVLTTISDITDRVNSERELNFSRQKLEEAEKNVHFGVYEVDLLSRQIKWSKEMYTIFERDPQLSAPSLDEYYVEYVHPDDVTMVRGNCEQMFQMATDFNFIYRINTQNGKTKYINCVGKVSTNSDSTPCLIQGTAMDITEKKQIESYLASERDILQIILDNVPDAIYFKDYQGCYIRANKALANLLGLDDPKELIGKTVFDVFPKEIADKIHEDEQTVFNTGLTLSQEREIPSPQGKIWLSAVIVGIRDLQGEVTQLVGISRDITQYKLVEDELRKAKEKAEAADKLKSAFLANMSHEIRTPINGILGFASLMEMRVFPRDKQVQYLRIINNSGKLLLSLINDIIDIAKIEAGQINFENSEVDVNELLSDLCDFYQGEKIKREKQHIDIYCSFPEEPVDYLVITDPFRVKQIINNLISNALKFTERGYIKFGYSIKDDQINFFVKDSGIGMSREETKVIFERFKQTGKPAKKKEGTGLGLAISKGLVELLGGKISVKSRVGSGSEFFFNIPMQKGSAKSFSPFANNQPDVLPDYEWHDKILLLVEDEEVNYRYIYDILEESKIKILHVTTAEEAIQICRSAQQIDIILMDMRLPGINGFEATRIIKKIRSEIPIIAQTAYAMENERRECFEAGCDQYLTKPFDQTILLSILNNFLQYAN